MKHWGIPVVAAIAVAGCSGGSDDSPTAAYTTSPTGVVAAAAERFDGAYDFCIEQVTDRLKAPTTAQFSERDRDHEAQTNGLYLFTGTVDSQNGFGAMIRSDWACKIRWSGGEYTAEAVTIS